MGKVVAVIFTAVVAPIVVFVATQHLGKKDEPADKKRNADKKAVERDRGGPGAKADGKADPDRIVAEGTGLTPAAARAAAYRTAAREAAARLVPPADQTRYEHAIKAVAAKDAESLVRQSHEVGAGVQKVMGAELYWARVAVSVDRSALAARLKAAGVPVGG